MRVDLRKCDTLTVSLPAQAARRASVSALCRRLGLDWRMVDGVPTEPGRIGCGLGHLRALRAARSGAPTLVLEDDVAASEGFDPIVDVPDDADALYVGVSLYGAIDVIDYVGFSNMIAADPVDERLLRIYNLLGAHAILYLSDRFRAASAEAILRAIADLDREHDKEMARLQETFVVYALRRPLFYQANALQRPEAGDRQEAMTRVELKPLTEGIVGQIEVDGVWRSIVLSRDEPRLRWRWAGLGGTGGG
jgi:hypothetical protein